jgi:PIN domain nuclease of toxin-antitoxin system
VIALLLDTHALIWLLHGDSRLSANARQAIDSVTELRSQVAISAISLIETAYLEEKARIPAGTLAAVLSLLDTPEPTLVEIPVGRQIVAALLGIPRDQVPDMPDRVIAATALHLSVPLVSRDRKIQTSQVETLW